MCDCRTNIEVQLLERFKAQSPDAKNHEASLRGYAIGITSDNSLYQVGVMPIELTADHPLKKGGYKGKTVKTSMHFTFCPFCGEQYKKGGA